jgi:ribonuclease HII
MARPLRSTQRPTESGSQLIASMAKKFDRTLIPSSPDLNFEQVYWSRGFQFIAGIDEAGRGALAGPVAAGAVILPKRDGLLAQLSGVRDSKQMTPEQRAEWVEKLRLIALAWGVGLASASEIDAFGIVPATRLAARRALQQLVIAPQHLLLDFLQLPEVPLPQTPLVKGDERSLTIAAASIFAKTTRDALLCDYERQYPGYGFAAHKGYGTAAHRLAMQRLGLSPIHRRSFQWKKEAISNEA